MIKNLISTIMKLTNKTKKKVKISIEYEEPQANSSNNSKRSSKIQKKESIFDSKIFLAETLRKEKSIK